MRCVSECHNDVTCHVPVQVTVHNPRNQHVPIIAAQARWKISQVVKQDGDEEEMDDDYDSYHDGYNWKWKGAQKANEFMLPLLFLALALQHVRCSTSYARDGDLVSQFSTRVNRALSLYL